MASTFLADFEAVLQAMEDDFYVLRGAFYLDATDLATCAAILAHIVSKARALSVQLISRLSLDNKKRILECLVQSTRIVGECAQKLFSWPEPTLDDMLAAWEPGLTRQYNNTDPLALRYSIIGMSVSELLAIEPDDRVLDLAANTLQLCSGTEMTVEFEEHDSVWLPKIQHCGDFAKGMILMCVVLTLMVLARSHSRWFDAANSHADFKLWGQYLPEATKNEKKRPDSATPFKELEKTPDKCLALTPQQEKVRDDKLKQALKRLITTDIQPNTSAQTLTTTPDKSWVVNDLVYRTRSVANILGYATSARSGRWGYVTKEYSDIIFHYAVLALRDLFQSAQKRFALPKGTIDTGTFQRAPARREEPNNREHLEARRFVILTGLDAMYSTSPLDSSRFDIAFTIIQYASGEDNVLATFPNGNKIALPAVLNLSEAWRKEMQQYAWHTVEGLAQFLSLHFDGKEVGMIDKVVKMNPPGGKGSIFAARKLVKVTSSGGDSEDEKRSGVGYPTFEVTEKGTGRLRFVVKK